MGCDSGFYWTAPAVALPDFFEDEISMQGKCIYPFNAAKLPP